MKTYLKFKELLEAELEIHGGDLRMRRAPQGPDRSRQFRESVSSDFYRLIKQLQDPIESRFTPTSICLTMSAESVAYTLGACCHRSTMHSARCNSVAIFDSLHVLAYKPVQDFECAAVALPLHHRLMRRCGLLPDSWLTFITMTGRRRIWTGPSVQGLESQDTYVSTYS